jgi:hypothetical protein
VVAWLSGAVDQLLADGLCLLFVTFFRYLLTFPMPPLCDDVVPPAGCQAPLQAALL